MDPDALAQALYDARRTRVPIRPLTETVPEMTVADAYAVQQRLVERLMADGDRLVGYKLGLTSRPMQEMFGVDQPDYGPLLSSMVLSDGIEVDLGGFIQPKIEAEIALVLERPLRGPGVTGVEAARAVGGAVAALELVDSRIADWKIALPDTIADLASCGAAILSSRIVPVDFDPRLVGMVIDHNGAAVATGAGAAALGDPLAAVAWLANTLAPYDVTLEPGHLIMTGSLHAAFDVTPGDVVRADFDRLGSVSVRFR